MFISDKLTYNTTKDLKFETSSETNLVAIKIDKHSIGSNKAIVVVMIYRPPSTSIATFNNQLSTLIDDVQKENKYVLFMGDFNVNVSKQIKGSKDIHEFTSLFLSNYFLSLIDKPTRITGKSTTLIVNIYTNISINNCHSGILCTDFSNHFPKFCIFDKLSVKKMKPPSVTKKNKAKNIVQFNRSLHNQNWDCVFNESTAQGAFTVFQGVIYLHIEMAFPMQTVTMNYKNKHGWMTDNLRSMIRRNKMYARRTRSFFQSKNAIQ